MAQSQREGWVHPGARRRLHCGKFGTNLPLRGIRVHPGARRRLHCGCAAAEPAAAVQPSFIPALVAGFIAAGPH